MRQSPAAGPRLLRTPGTTDKINTTLRSAAQIQKHYSFYKQVYNLWTKDILQSFNPEHIMQGVNNMHCTVYTCLDMDTERILVILITIDHYQGGIMRSCWSNCLDIRPIVFQWSEDISLASHLTMGRGGDWRDAGIATFVPGPSFNLFYGK